MDILLYLAGGLGVAIGVVHAVLGELRVVGPATTPTVSAKRVLRAIMFLSGVYWSALGAALIAAPFLSSVELKLGIAYVAAAVFLSAAAANFWATQGKHFGWVLLSIAGVLALAGVWS